VDCFTYFFKSAVKFVVTVTDWLIFRETSQGREPSVRRIMSCSARYIPWGYFNDETAFQPEAGECYNEAVSVVKGKIILNLNWMASALLIA
jgi:hypothetical protein